MRKQLQRRLHAVASHRREHPRGFIRSLHIVRPDRAHLHQDRWLDLAERCVLADVGREVGERLLLTLHVEADRRVHVDAGPWRYLVGIDEHGPESVATVLQREERRW